MVARRAARSFPVSPAFVAALTLWGCAPAQDPPGRNAEAPRPPVTLRRPGAEEAPKAPAGPSKEALEPGRGAKIASIAMHTWIYVAPNDRSTKLGYLRAGAVVDRGEASAGT